MKSSELKELSTPDIINRLIMEQKLHKSLSQRYSSFVGYVKRHHPTVHDEAKLYTDAFDSGYEKARKEFCDD